MWASLEGLFQPATVVDTVRAKTYAALGQKKIGVEK